jgi:prevent-host-death family protein
MTRHVLPEMQTVKATEARRHWSQILNQVAHHKTRMLVEKSGIRVAVMISVDEFERLQRLEADWDEPFAALDRTRAAFEDLPAEDREREAAKAVSEARAALRAEQGRAAKPA